MSARLCMPCDFQGFCRGVFREKDKFPSHTLTRCGYTFLFYNTNMNYHRIFMQNSFVHIVLVSYGRKPIFTDNITLLRKAFANSKKFFKYEIVAICILPDHIHLILNPENIDHYPKIITAIKYYFSRNSTAKTQSPSYGYLNKKEKGIFQRRYFEHTILNENDLNNQINYIHYNPVKHGYVKSVKDWGVFFFRKIRSKRII